MNKNKLPVKKNLSSIQVLKTLQVLMQDNYTMTELIEKLNENEDEPIFNNSVISKYINTCRFCGIKIPKIHNKYFVTNLPFGMNLNTKEFTLLTNMQNYVRSSCSKRFNKSFNNFMDKIIRYSNKDIVKIDEEDEDNTRYIFEKAIHDERKICLMFKAKMDMECIPLCIVKHKGKTYFRIYHKGKEKLVSLERIAGLKILNEKFIIDNPSEVVQFKLTGDLAARYQIREHEEIISNKPGEYKIISNKGESKIALLSRLMRYDNLCEIIRPQSYRDAMKNLINDTLANYGE